MCTYRWRKGCITSDTLDRVSLPPRGLELAAQMVGGLAVVRHQLVDALSDAVLDAGDLAPDLIHVGALRAVALALTPQPRVLVAQVGDRTRDLAVQASSVLCLCARDLLAAVPAEDDQRAHLTSITSALLSSRSRPGSIANTESGRPAAAQTTGNASRSRSMNTRMSVACPNGGTPPIA